jgi:hypothetical protein
MPKDMKYSTADKKAQAVSEIESLVKSGSTARDAVEQVAYRTGIGERTLWTCLKKTKGVAIDDREAALERKKTPPRKRLQCHPDAEKLFFDLCRAGGVIAECYRQMVAQAQASGWSPILPEHTMRRKLNQEISWSERYAARRATKSAGK